MISIFSILLLGFFLGMRHATDPDHVVAVSTIVSRERTLRAAAPLGAIWGLGHTVTILVVGGAIVLFGIVVPPRVGLTMELSVALMLMLLGGLSLARSVRQTRGHDAPPDPGHERAHAVLGGLDRRLGHLGAYRILRPLVVGVVHGLAGSAAVALLVMGTIHEPGWALAYLVVFGAGTIAGMLLITTALAIPFAYVAQRFERLHRGLGLAAGVSSLALGALLVYEIGFVQGLFTSNPQWTPG
ncbi:high-affinity nickel-transport family protein [Polyangium sp. 6x1]|uniref:HoxN/HupN/NixA family nickel/cobalt transporter n=1 Tax=Polyangium sp. 6x1 TaxID=3042689 RepID=UPI0024823035|nr:high-affinity nickel-transport family protein [Polyangium sp. 6x1]MDI1450615.1 high-affinity nickel-transport family protein [Polyangium sp. 6x1]